MAGDVLDFNALEGLTCGFKTVREGIDTWKLRDDVRADVLLDFLRMAKLERRVQEAFNEQDEAAIEAAVEDLYAMSLRICVSIFRHTYRGMSKDDIASRFSHTDRQEIILLFFGSDGSASAAPTPEPSNSSEATISNPTKMTSTKTRVDRATGKSGTSRTPRQRATKGKRSTTRLREVG